LKQSEFTAEQSALSRMIDTGSRPRLLVILENFEGWERGADWNDLDFLLSYSHKITKIAIVAEPRWETLALAFAGAGVRRAQVKFFPPNELERRRVGWRNNHVRPEISDHAIRRRSPIMQFRRKPPGEKSGGDECGTDDSTTPLLV
jgi:SpoIIAA-like